MKGDEYQKCIAYLEEELKFKVFLDKQVELYKNALRKHGGSMLTNKLAHGKVVEAGNRLVESAVQLLGRRESIVSIPEIASDVYAKWQRACLDYRDWANCTAIEAIIRYGIPNSKQVKELLSQFEKSRHRAEEEQRKLVKQLGLSHGEVDKMFNNASASILSEDWSYLLISDEIHPDASGILGTQTFEQELSEVRKQVSELNSVPTAELYEQLRNVREVIDAKRADEAIDFSVEEDVMRMGVIVSQLEKRKAIFSDEDEIWFQQFMDIYEGSELLIESIIEVDEEGLPADLRSILQAKEELEPVMEQVKKLPKPKRKALRDIKKNYEKLLSSCIKSSEKGLQLADSVYCGDWKITQRNRLTSVVIWIERATKEHDSLSEKLNSIKFYLPY